MLRDHRLVLLAAHAVAVLALTVFCVLAFTVFSTPDANIGGGAGLLLLGVLGLPWSLVGFLGGSGPVVVVTAWFNVLLHAGWLRRAHLRG